MTIKSKQLQEAESFYHELEQRQLVDSIVGRLGRNADPDRVLAIARALYQRGHTLKNANQPQQPVDGDAGGDLFGGNQ